MYEIDFLPVGDGERSGDAIALRFSDVDGATRVVIVDGGFDDDGEDLVQHVKTWYATDIVDAVICTHPDSDHINGLHHVLENLRVRELILHDPRTYANGLNLGEMRFEKVFALIEQARQFGIPVTEPYPGLSRFGVLTILGPSPDYYTALLSAQALELKLANRVGSAFKSAVELAASGLRSIAFRPREKLTDSGDPGPRNNSSVITHLALDGDGILLTGDAGIDGLNMAWDWIETARPHLWSLPLRYIQAPHHGSRRNVGPSILNRLLGGHTEHRRGTCLVSASADAPRNPNPMVVNSFELRGYGVFTTNGLTIHSFKGASDRGWTSMERTGFVDDSGEDDNH